jgi:hypothetical protein
MHQGIALLRVKKDTWNIKREVYITIAIWTIVNVLFYILAVIPYVSEVVDRYLPYGSVFWIAAWYEMGDH